MTKRNRILLVITSILLIAVVIIGLYANTTLEKKVAELLKEKLPSHIENSYKSIKIHSLRGSITINEPTIIIKDKDSGYVTAKLYLDKIEVNNVSYLDFYFDKEININNIVLDGLKVTYFKKQPKPKEKDTLNKKLFNNFISVKKFKIKNASVNVYDETKDSLLLSSTNINLEIRKLQLDNTWTIKTFKNNYKSFSISADSIFLKSGIYDNLTMEHFKHSKENILIVGLSLKTKYSKNILSKIIRKERDHYNIYSRTINLSEVDYGFDLDTFYFKSSLLTVDNTVAKIYRDKLVTDDFKIKNMYSKSVRELPINLTIDSVSVSNSKIVFSTKSHVDSSVGVLTISNIKADVSNLSNTYTAPKKTVIIVDGTFMKESPFHAKWSFDISNKNDEFEFIGDVGNIYGNSLNTLLTPLINAKIEGKIEQTLFTIHGNSETSIIYMSQKYEHIKIEILNKNKKKNKVVSGIANVFVHRNSENKGKDFNNITADATRDNTKSFFNYLARNLKAALLVSFFEKSNKKHQEHKNQEDLRKDSKKSLSKKEARRKSRKEKKKKN